MRNPFFYILLLVLVVLDGWLLSHPNLIGQAGVFFFDYTYLETFPRALGTVSIVVGAALLLSWIVSRVGRPLNIILMAVLLAASVFYLFQSFTQYNTGIYKLTGAGFRAGAVLLPGLVVLVFGKGLFDSVGTKRR
ncbi:hypothetical protein DYU11_01305 [Fibrisoma montanum]|uniref:DUF4293 family protein n=1 Tax=Fibrisoma montanum TaxID=2305895 RepID=A0A418MHT7_9BACT|nr:hypothetical protein [Fibrisoma montanum]RIV26986.1 hypothetical protein DYU11_01305 [Fibrisoma montanum]